MKFVYLWFDNTIFGSSDNLLSNFGNKEGAFEYWGQLKRLCHIDLWITSEIERESEKQIQYCVSCSCEKE